MADKDFVVKNGLVVENGNISVTGTVDGRDIATDGTKLDTIETNADVTDTTNVTAAGALMDSELTNIAAVKALNQGVSTTDSPSFAGLTATTADINGGTIDNANIATSNITVGAGKTLNVSAGTLTLANDQISGDKIQGGTIGSTTITTLTGTTGNITNVNATTVDATNVEVTNIKAKDGTAAATIANTTGVVTIPSAVLTTADINGGTIDGVTIGGASAGAGTFTSVTGTSLDMNGNADFAGNITLSQAAITSLKRSDNTGGVSIQAGADALSSSLVMYGNAHASLPSWVVFEGDTMVLRSVDNIDFVRFIDGTGTIFNETSADLDFRIESDTYSHAFFLQGSDGYVGINTSTPEAPLTITPGATSATSIGGRDISYGVNTIVTSGRTGYLCRVLNNYTAPNDNAGFQWIYPFDTGGSADNKIFRSSTGATLVDKFWVNQGGGGYFASDVGIGTSSPAEKLHISGTGETILVTPVLYAANQDSPYLIASGTTYNGATTNWGTYGFQHRLKVNSSGVPRVTIDTNTGELFSVANAGVGIGIESPYGKLDVSGTVYAKAGALFNPPGVGTDTSTTSAFALDSGSAIVGVNNGYIRNMLSWTSGSDIIIGQSGTSLIGGINLRPGSSGTVSVTGILTTTANTTIGGSLQIDGDLTVSGETVTINVTDLAVEDNMIYLNSGSVVTNPDIGFAGNYNDGTYAHAGFFRDASDGYFKVFKGYTLEPDASAFIDTSHASFALADIQAANFRGALVGNASTASSAAKWTNSRTVTFATGDVTGSFSIDGSGNVSDVALTVANDSHTHDGRYYTETESNDLYMKRGTPTLTTNIDTIASSSDVIRWNNTTVGRPASGQVNEYGPLLQMSYNGTDVSQLAHELDQDNLYFRKLATSTDLGSSWKRLFHDDYHPNADQWTNSRTVTFATGDVTGSFSIDGSGDVSGVALTVGNDSHTHDTRYYTESEIDTKLTNGTVTTIANQWSNVIGNMTGFVNDGGGNLGIRFNATPGSPNNLVENGIAYELEVVNDSSTGNLTFYKGSTSTGTAGETISWTDAFTISGSDNYLYGYGQKIFTDTYHPNADQWTTPRTLSLSGDVSGSVSWDGSANADISVTVSDDSHNHTGSSGDFTVGGDLIVSGGQVSNIAVSSRDKYRVWNSGTYTIGMASGFTFGGLGSEYAMTFQMSDTATRGFWWGDSSHTNAQGAMALTTDGKLTVAHSVRLGYGEGDTTVPGATYALDVSGDTRIDGTVGIGTSIPRSQVHIYGAGQTTANLTDSGNMGGILRVSGSETTAGAGGGIIFASLQSDDTQTAGMAAIKGLLNNGNTNTIGSLAFSTRAAITDTALTERMRLTWDGKLGIGTETPQALLDVTGSTGNQLVVGTLTNAGNTEAGILFKHHTTVSNYDGGGIRSIRNGTSNDFDLSLDIGADGVSTQAMFISGVNATRGNVGIGTTNPGSILHARQDQDGTTRAIIQNRLATGTPVSELTFLTGTLDITDNRYAYIQSAGASANYLAFGTSNGAAPVEHMRINASGLVDIIGNLTAEHAAFGTGASIDTNYVLNINTTTAADSGIYVNLDKWVNNSTEYGIFVDIDATTAIDDITANRTAYGIRTDINTYTPQNANTTTGYQYNSWAGYFNAVIDDNTSPTYTGGKTNTLYGTYSRARHDGLGGASNVRGAYNFAQAGSNSTATPNTIDFMYSTHSYLINSSNSTTITNAYGSYNWINQDVAGGTTTNAYGVVSRLDRDAGTAVNGYAFQGLFEGTWTGVKRGLWITGDLDNSVDGNFSIGGSVNIGGSGSTALNIASSSGTFTNPSDNSTASAIFYNSNNTSTTAHSSLALRTNGANSGDPFISFDISGATGWSIGIDNSDSDRFKISNSWADVGTNVELLIESNGNLTTTGNIFASGGRVHTNEVTTNNGAQLILFAGESTSSGYTGLTGESVYVVAEAGLQVISSSNNWTDSVNGGWATANPAVVINNGSGESYFPGTITIGDGTADSRLIIKRVDGTVADDIQFFNGTTRVGEIGTLDTTWLRINQQTAKNIYTPRVFRADGGFQSAYYRNSSDTNVTTVTGGISAGGNIELYGPSHASVPNRIFYDAAVHTFRDHDASSTYAILDATNFTVNGDIIPSTDNTGNVGTSARTFSRGWFTNLTVDSTIDVRGAIDFADSDILRMGSSDDFKMYYDGSANEMEFEMEETCNQIRIHDNGTTRFTLERATGNFTATGITQSNGFYSSGTGTGTGFRNNGTDGASFPGFTWNNDETTGMYRAGGSNGLGFTTAGVSRCVINNLSATFSVDVVANSDIRLKKDIENIANALEKVNKLNGVNFTKTANDKRSTGLIAQDVQAVLPEAVSENEEGYLSIAYGNLVGLLVEAIKEQDSTINSLRNDVETLKELVNKLMETR